MPGVVYERLVYNTFQTLCNKGATPASEWPAPASPAGGSCARARRRIAAGHAVSRIQSKTQPLNPRPSSRTCMHSNPKSFLRRGQSSSPIFFLSTPYASMRTPGSARQPPGSSCTEERVQETLEAICSSPSRATHLSTVSSEWVPPCTLECCDNLSVTSMIPTLVLFLSGGSLTLRHQIAAPGTSHRQRRAALRWRPKALAKNARGCPLLRRTTPLCASLAGPPTPSATRRQNRKKRRCRPARERLRAQPLRAQPLRAQPLRAQRLRAQPLRAQPLRAQRPGLPPRVPRTEDRYQGQEHVAVDSVGAPNNTTQSAGRERLRAPECFLSRARGQSLAASEQLSKAEEITWSVRALLRVQTSTQDRSLSREHVHAFTLPVAPL